jgi:hypothetical protein
LMTVPRGAGEGTDGANETVICAEAESPDATSNNKNSDDFIPVVPS